MFRNAQCTKCARHAKAIAHLKFFLIFNVLGECMNARWDSHSCIYKGMILKVFLNTRNAPLTGDVRAPPLARLRARPEVI